MKKKYLGRCAYCQELAVCEDAIGIPTCFNHKHYTDDYYERRTGRRPDEDPFLYCDEHCDMWQEGCPRCEKCSQYHYEMSVKESAPQRTMTIISF